LDRVKAFMSEKKIQEAVDLMEKIKEKGVHIWT
jgi:pentatricopeptide repeat protein